MEKARKERGDNLFAACAAACLSLLLGLMEYVTRFATVRAAITGEAFFAAGRNVVNLLRRNFMDAFGVWWVRGLAWQDVVLLCSVLRVHGPHTDRTCGGWCSYCGGTSWTRSACGGCGAGAGLGWGCESRGAVRGVA